MKRLISCAILFLSSVASFGQVAAISGRATDAQGYPIPYAQIRVCPASSTGTPCTPTQAIYQDYNETVPAANPYTTDQYGNYTVYASAPASGPDLYTVEVSANNGLTWTYVNNGPQTGAGFPVVLGSTSIQANSTNTSLSGLTVNGVTLQSTGSASEFLNGTGAYSAVAATTPNALTGAASGGAAPGATFNGSAPVTFDYHTLGAAGVSGTPTAGNCTDWVTSTTIGDSGAPCGTGSGGITSINSQTGPAISFESSDSSISVTTPSANTIDLTTAGASAAGADLATQYNQGGVLAGAVGSINAALPIFGNGAPVLSLTTSGSCRSNPTITITGNQTAEDATTATAAGYCINGQVVSTITFPGGGYTSATCKVTGGGTNWPTCTVNLETAGAADQTGTNDSTAAMQNAADYAIAKAQSPNSTAQLYIPQGYYKLTHRLYISDCDLWIVGDGESASILNLADTSEDGIDVVTSTTHPDAWNCRGGIKDLDVYASQGASYTADQIYLNNTTGFSLINLDVSGGGGRGIATRTNTERLYLQNIELDTVRWPLILTGNENHVHKLNIQEPGMAENTVTEPDGTTGNYCFGTGNCVNGEYPSTNWNGGTLEYASSNGTTATFYVHSSSSTYPNSPIIAGMHFYVTGTTTNVLAGYYTATSVTNGITSDPSGLCTTSNTCFEVQATSAVNGVASLAAPSTTATFSSGTYELTLTSTAGFVPNESITGTGIPSGSRIQSVNGSIVVINNATTAAGSGVTVTGQTGWYPTIAPDHNSAVTFAGADVQITDGSIKSLPYANCFQDIGSFGSKVSNFYCEGFPIGGQPTVNSVLQMGGWSPYTSLTGALPSANGGVFEQVGVVDDSWFPEYVNDPSMLYNGSGSNYAILVIEPQDFLYGSTAASAYVPGVERGQLEVVQAVFTANNQLVVLSRNQSGSTAPSGTAWPAGSLVAEYTQNSIFYGPMEVANMHANVGNPPNQNWSMQCNDQSVNGNICGAFLIGGEPNNVSVFTTGQAPQGAGFRGASLISIANELWGTSNEGEEALGSSFFKSIGGGGDVTLLQGSSSTYLSGYGNEATLGQLYNYGYVNVKSWDGSYPYSSFRDAADGTFFDTNTNEGVTAIANYATGSGPGSPSGAQVGLQFENSYCYWDTSSVVDGHAQTRWCFVGGPSGTPMFREDSWTGTAWTPVYQLNGPLPALSGNNNWTGTNSFGGLGSDYFSFSPQGFACWPNCTNPDIRSDVYGNWYSNAFLSTQGLVAVSALTNSTQLSAIFYNSSLHGGSWEVDQAGYHDLLGSLSAKQFYQNGSAMVVPTTGVATLAAGTVTVSSSAACAAGASCTYQFTHCGSGGTAGILSLGTVTAGTSFVIQSTSATDAAQVCWSITP